MKINLLELKNVSKSFGGVNAVNNLSLVVAPGTIHGLVGPNGAGKTTAFNLISGVLKVNQGEIEMDGAKITNLSVNGRVKKGICRTFQTPHLFEDMSALETVMTGCHIHGSIGIIGSMFRVISKLREEATLEISALQYLKKVALEEYKDTITRNLSYGHRRLLEIARALATNPKILLLDEVVAGLNLVETQSVGNLIRSLAKEGITILIVEHDMRFIIGLCDNITVLNFGFKIAEGTPEEIVRNQEVIKAYLGSPESIGANRKLGKKASD
jgi:branched-chain amino acid transport system ATP-binding protein